MRLTHPSLTQEASFTIHVDGVAVQALGGETIAAALAAAGELTLRRTRQDAPRGLYCGMGACFDCLVTVDDRQGVRACLEKVVPGMRIVRGIPAAGALAALAEQPASIPENTCDVLIIGAGPAGLTAAQHLAQGGANVVVLDERPQPGGQYFKPLAPSHTTAQPLDSQFSAGAALTHAAVAAGATVWSGAVVWWASREDGIAALIDGAVRWLKPRVTILATGAYERPTPMPGWTLPGVMTTGGLQTLVRSYRVVPCERIIIAGNGPLGLQLACELLDAGVHVAAVVEAAQRPFVRAILPALRMVLSSPKATWQGLSYLTRLRLAGVPVHWGSRVTRITGRERAEAAVVENAGGRTTIPADVVTLGYGFLPQSELARQLGCAMDIDPRHAAPRVITDEWGRTSVSGIYAIGDGAVIGGAQVAMARAVLAATAVAEEIKLALPSILPSRARKALRGAERFQSALWQVFAAPRPDIATLGDATIVCRCEEVSAGRIRAACAEGAPDAGVIKRLTRAGMGRCQGRYCAETIARIAQAADGPTYDAAGGPPFDAASGFAPRPPAKPIPLAALALEQPEWGGHKLAAPQAMSPRAPHVRPDFGTIRTDVAVIGAGVVGACVAYELALRGVGVTVLDRHAPNLQASGANAGSLHIQLLSFDFGARAQAGGGPAAQTLMLAPAAVAAWIEIERFSGRDLDIRTPGGLMVAETETALRFLDQKAALERSYGIDTRMVDAGELQRLEPHLWTGLLGAAFCAQEGKINPLTATYAVVDLARAEGAVFEAYAGVLGLTREGGGPDAAWRIKTEAGIVIAKRVVNCTGGWAARISQMAGSAIPVSGAPLQMIVTEPGPAMVTHLVAHADRRLSLKQAATGGLIIGGGWSAGLDATTGASRALPGSIAGNAWIACRVLPQAAALRAIRIWAGMNVNIDGAPIIGEMPGAPGFWNCVTSNGYTLAPIVARMTAQMMTQGRSELPSAPFTLARFT